MAVSAKTLKHRARRRKAAALKGADAPLWRRQLRTYQSNQAQAAARGLTEIEIAALCGGANTLRRLRRAE